MDRHRHRPLTGYTSAFDLLISFSMARCSWSAIHCWRAGSLPTLLRRVKLGGDAERARAREIAATIVGEIFGQLGLRSRDEGAAWYEKYRRHLWSISGDGCELYRGAGKGFAVLLTMPSRQTSKRPQFWRSATSPPVTLAGFLAGPFGTFLKIQIWAGEMEYCRV
jgi:hypothetical protein